MAHRPHNFRALSKPKKMSKKDHKHYVPFVPLILLVIGTFLLSILQPLQNINVLAYSTNVTIGGLLQSTNDKRAQNSVGSLQINSALNSAAQAKANDMIARNYWAHITPDGQEPWIFMDGAGYKYQKAGENLAYGFATSVDTINGWMNSQTHKDNMLDSVFSEVGFGFANGSNFNNSGEETVVVAMYGKPVVLSATNENTTSQSPAEVESSPSQSPVPEPEPAQATESIPDSATPVNSDYKQVIEPDTVAVARVQTITKGQAPWTLFVVGLITGLAIMLILIKHMAGLRHLLRDSERFILHHPLLDTILVSFVLMGTFLSQTSGFIR